MFPITAAQLLSLPEGGAPNAGQRLPWTNGSLLAAKLDPADASGFAQLLLGGFRLRARVPPATPMGHIWLLLIDQEMPARFRLLSEAQAMHALIQMLHKSSSSRMQRKTAGASDEKQASGSSAENSWSGLETDSLPFSVDITANGQHLLLRDQKDGSPHVVLNHSVSSDYFCIRGRVDLECLGAVVFTLEGSAGHDWRLRVFSGNPQGLSHLRAGFDTWMNDKQEKYEHLDGKLMAELPDNLSSLPDDIQA